ncbi:HD domain-containing protein [Leptospira interrogans]
MLKAAHQAAVWHAGQRRKGAKQVPYINHLLEVSELIANSPEGRGDENVIAAALLHDAIEDQEITAEIIAEMFNRDVADLVLEVTDDTRQAGPQGSADYQRTPQVTACRADQASR